MKLTVNREECQVDGETPTVLELLEGRVPANGSLAVAVNGDIVPRAEWVTQALGEDDEVEIVRAVSGGDHLVDDALEIAGVRFASRLFLGTGK